MSGRILVVDDSLTVRMNLMDMLAAADLPVLACATLAEARRALASEDFALVILDVLLPDGDGIELLREIRADAGASGMAVMLLSSEAEIRDRIRGLTTGADEYVGKPYDPGYLVARARELARRDVPAERKGETILLIDDSLTFREELKAALEEACYRVLLAGSGEEGLHLAADLRPSAVIVDGMLPGIDGATVVRRIRLDAALRGLPCLLLTGSEDRSEEVRALDAGADAFVRKDESIMVILARLSAMLRSAGGQKAERATASLSGPKKVLAVDDSETYLQQLADGLRADGYELVLARSGEEALQMLEVQPVDCILLDVIMPGIGGQETCRRIKGVPGLRDTPIIMLTAVDDRDAVIQGLAAGADDYIAKSCDLDVLRARVLAQIRRKQFEDENRLIREHLLRAEIEALEAQAARQIAEARASLVEQLEAKNEELESFSYSVAHDLRAPLRSIDGFGLILLEDYADKLDDEGKKYLAYVRESAQQMARLIDDLLALSRVTRAELRRAPVDISALARSIAGRLAQASPQRVVELVIADGLRANGDDGLIAIALDNLLGNAWKFTRDTAQARIEVGESPDEPGTFFVRDNGAGFDMAYASKLFGMFQRLHSPREFEGTGIGLATVRRIVRRHGGRIRAEGAVGRGATFLFSLGKGAGADPGVMPDAKPARLRAQAEVAG
ncbi:MAG TPA: response regulator [Xanthobacteraceae bacterium]|nr:response regulator [Xanthobacteraceae bacterium]